MWCETFTINLILVVIAYPYWDYIRIIHVSRMGPRWRHTVRIPSGANALSIRLTVPYYRFPSVLWVFMTPIRWRHNERDSVSNHQPRDCLLNCLFRRRWKKTSKLRVTGLSAGNSPGTGEFPPQMASNAENVSIWWRRHVIARPIETEMAI